MLKRMVKILAAGLCAVLLNTSVIYAENLNISGLAREQGQIQPPLTLLEMFGPGAVYLQEQSESLEIYFEMKEQIDTYKNEYQDTYAGMYLDDNGKLNVLVVSSQEGESAQNSVQKVAEQKKTVDMYEALADTCAEDGQDIEIKQAAYALEQLESIQEELMAHAGELGIISTAIIQRENIIEVRYLIENEKFDRNKVIGLAGESDCLKFVALGEFQNDSGAVPNGSALSFEGVKGTVATITCGAKRGGKYGFITAAHVGNVGQKIQYDGKNLGTITYRNYGKQSDVAFIERASNDWLLTNQYVDHKAYTTGKDLVDGALYVSGGFPEGTYVNKYGAKTGITWGRITSRLGSHIDPATGIETNYLVEADYKSEPGDSGGPVRVEVTRNGSTYRYCAGIHKGSYSNVQLAVYSDMDYAKANLGFVGFYTTTAYQ